MMAQSVKPGSFVPPGSTTKSVSQSTLQAEEGGLSPELIEVFPPEVTFKDIEIEQTYEVTICVRNLSPRVRRIRFTPPKTSKFVAQYETLGALAVGMALNVVVTFETDQLGDFHDELVIKSEGLTDPIIVQLHAFRPRPEINFDPFVNLGFTTVGKPTAGAINIWNEGSIRGDVRILFDKQLTPELTVVPETITLDAGERTSVALSYVSKEVNTFRCVLEVEVDGQDIVRHVDVNANCVEQQLALVASTLEKIPGSEPELGASHMAMTSSINFGTMYHGQSRDVQAFLVNVGPFSVNYSINFVQGSEDEAESEHYKFMTPQEMAEQSMKRAFDASPLSGEVPAFSQVPINFVCLSKKRENMKGWVHNMMEEKNTAEDISSSQVVDNEASYFYTAIFKFQDLDNKLGVQLQARAIFPNVDLSHTSVHFHECPVNENRDFPIKMENKNEELPVDFEFSQIAHFAVEPKKGNLLPLQTKSVIITFKPGNFGSFENTTLLSFINGAYKVPIKLYGQSSRLGTRSQRKRGPESDPTDFTQQRRYISQEEIARGTQVSPKQWLQETFPTQLDASRLGQEVDEVILQQNVKQHYNDFLKESRRQRLRTAHEKRMNTAFPTKPTFEDLEKNIELCLHTAPPRSRNLQLPASTNTLVVEKPIGKYDTINSKAKAATHDPDKPVKNSYKKVTARSKMDEIPFFEKPVRQQDVKECSLALSPADLSLISAGPKEMRFDQIVIRSEVSKWFSVENGLKQNIYVELSSAADEINRIEPESIVIPPGLKGGFKVTVMCVKKQRVDKEVRYTINGKHSFQFMVQAEVEPAVLDLEIPDQPSTSTSLPFLHFKFDDDNMEESLSKQVLVLNRSPAPGKFSWQLPVDSNFEVEPREETVEALKQRMVIIRFVPGLSQVRNEEETLIMKVDNGDSQSLVVKGEVSEARCSFVQKSLDFGVVAVGLRVEKPIQLKNSDPKNAIFHVKNFPSQLIITPMRGRIQSEAKFPLKVMFSTVFEEEVNGELEIIVRGGKAPLKLNVHANAIIPKVYIQEPDIDFGEVTINSTLARRFTLVNESPIPAILYLNLEDNPEFEVSMPSDDTDAESSVLVPATSDKESPFYLKEDDEDMEDPKPDPMMNEEESEEDEVEEVHRKFKITVGGGKTVPLLLRFSPKDTEQYHFNLPIVLAGINQTVSGLQKTVNGEGLKPRFMVEPATLKFKNKVISAEKNFPSLDTILLSNPDIKAISWRIDVSGLDAGQVFSIKPNEGTLETGTYANLRVGFNPTQPTTYEERVNLYLDNMTDPYMTLTLQGEGTVPKITFDRREVIFPIVPLNLQAKVTFFILNGGYENVELSYSIPKDAGSLEVTLIFPDGKQLGVTKQKISVEAAFTSARPLSFTTRIDFFDSESNRYSINISGTADNSLLTAFPFIQRNPDEVQFEIEEGLPVMLVQDVESDMEMYSEKGKSGGHRTSGGSSVVSRSARSIIGFNPIPQPLLERSLEFLTRWLNHNILSSPINKLPDDVIEAHGAQVYELVFSLTGKYPPGQVKNFSIPARELTKVVYNQYSDLLAYLKTNGALLNTIRPEYLLGLLDFSRYLKLEPTLLQLKQRQIERRWPYLSMDAWITLLYQIIKVFIVNRINPKTFRSLPGISPEKAIIDSTMNGSNIYSLAENIVLKWMSYHFNEVYPSAHRRLTNFDKDLMDGSVVGAVIQSHVGLAGSLIKLKPNPTSDDQKKTNVEKVLQALNEIGMATFLTQKDLTGSAISPREMVLFCLSLYQSLPHYIPKCTIEFPCVLGEAVVKNLELSNPSNKQITYWVKLEGSTDFILSHTTEFSISPRGTEMFPIKFQSRLSSEVKASLRFTSRASEGSAHAAAMVFNLVSKVLSRRSEKTFECEAHLYELTTKDIEVTNASSVDGEFLIQIVYPEKVSPVQAQARTKKSSPNRSVVPESTIQFPKPFFIKSEKVKVKKNSTNTVSLVFMPFDVEKQEAFVIFTDDKVGEMQYTVIGTVLPPKVDKADQLATKGEMGDMLVIPVPIHSRNFPFERAKTEALQRVGGANRTKERDQLKDVFKNLSVEDTGVFDVSIDSPFFAGPTSISIYDSGKKGKGPGTLDTSQISYADNATNRPDTTSLNPDPRNKKKGQASRSSIAEKTDQLILTLTPRQPGEYVCNVTLTNAKKTDIRTLEVVAQIKPKKSKVTMELTAQAREIVTQEIPIINNSDKEWQVKVRLSQDSDLFTSSKDMIVRKRTTGNCLISFKPEWVCEAKAKLEIEIPSGETYEFEVLGHGEEPRAEDHLVLECRVKERSKHVISVPNPRTYPVTYRVVSDVMNATGETTVEVAAGGTTEYELTMYPLQSGTYTGSITFYDPQNRFFWYTLEVQAATPEPEEAKELRVQCRKALEFKITVFNPLPEDTVFDVNVMGAGLFGDAEFAVPGRETGIYQLLYSPLLPGEGEGAVKFLSEKTGEFWYQLRLVCDPAEPIEKELFECDLGKSVAKPINLENPSNKEVILDYKCSNVMNFELIPDKIILPPFGSVDALIKYSPTSLKFIETGEIHLASKEVGDWVFLLKGKGLPPSEMEPIIVTASIGESNSIQVPYKNPFREAISVSVSLETANPEVFQLLLRRAKFSIGPLGMLLIPVAFQPQSMEERSATLLVSQTEELTWKYALRGITERPSTKVDFIFKTKCRTTLEKDFEILLHDLGNLPEQENFTHELQVLNPEVASLVTKSFKLEPLNSVLSDALEPLRFAIKFEPLRPFKAEAELFIYKGTGGRWRYNVLIEAKDPDIDDTIVIEALMHKRTSVSFRLSNHFKQYATFEAFFTPESDPFFTVEPTSGLLPAYGKDGIQFVVSFKPVEYGAPKTGMLVIRTDDMQWSYLIKGTHPHYKKPDVAGGRLDNKLSRDAIQSAQQHSRKNFIKNNIVGSRKSPGRTGDFTKTRGGTRPSTTK